MELATSSHTPHFRLPQGPPPPLRNPGARRCLFLSPSEVADAQRANAAFLDRLLDEQTQRQSRKWGFDFAAGQPLPSSSIQYELVDEKTLPQFYHSVQQPLPTPPTNSSDEENESDSENSLPHHPNIVLPAPIRPVQKSPKAAETPKKQQSIIQYLTYQSKHSATKSNAIKKPRQELVHRRRVKLNVYRRLEF